MQIPNLIRSDYNYSLKHHKFIKTKTNNVSNVKLFHVAYFKLLILLKLYLTCWIISKSPMNSRRKSEFAKENI